MLDEKSLWENVWWEEMVGGDGGKWLGEEDCGKRFVGEGRKALLYIVVGETVENSLDNPEA